MIKVAEKRIFMKCPHPERKEVCLKIHKEILGNPALAIGHFDLYTCPWKLGVRGICPYKSMKEVKRWI